MLKVLSKKRYEQLMDRLDETSFKLQVSHPVPSPAENPRSVGLIITKDTKVEEIPDDQLPLAHTMLHLFNTNKSGRGLSKETIKRLHNGIVPLLKSHSKFDGLDKNDD